ncbi:ATP-grasp enzyme [Actinomycetospora sp. TBRC 11914]|uniref:ATP-grasp enzyme n=1 Tax=Actinomycetospora sp. TBRC 11914 TaxID=2729387 RepID=UPI00145CFEE5|nr:ATP-grasp enzyme [Actinomycetospora sp. TBRC 11914]NMO88411.1 ATP-grasp enzyme [Actinomycetospora sp. TBRC 11914]
MSTRWGTAARTLGTQALLLAALPATAAVTAGALVRSAVVGTPARGVPERPRTVLVSGGKMTKALTLARAFHAAGHRVVLVESGRYRLTGHRFSRAVDAFHVVPPPEDPGYADALVDVVRREGVDVYVPVCSPASSRYDALAKPVLEQWCEVLHGDAEAIDTVDDKAAFAEAARASGLSVPETHRVTSPDEVAAFAFPDDGTRYVLKSIPYDAVNRLDLTPLPRPTREETAAFARSKPIGPDTPWILQAFVPGREYCTHGTARDGRLRVYCCCESSAFQVNYAPVDVPAIERWVETFVAERKLTGQYSFDVMVGEDGEPVALECNPRTHSAITMFHDQPGDLARAYLEHASPGRDDSVLRPSATGRPTYWLYHELWRMLRHPTSAPERLRVVLRGTDAIFDLDDPLPFLLVHHLQIPVLLWHALREGRRWVRIDFNIGKLVEPAGD